MEKAKIEKWTKLLVNYHVPELIKSYREILEFDSFGLHLCNKSARGKEDKLPQVLASRGLRDIPSSDRLYEMMLTGKTFAEDDLLMIPIKSALLGRLGIIVIHKKANAKSRGTDTELQSAERLSSLIGHVITEALMDSYIGPSDDTHELETDYQLIHAGILPIGQQQAVIMFIDLRNSTSLMKNLESDSKKTFFGLWDSFLKKANDTIVDTFGVTNRYLGDGLMAVWGISLYGKRSELCLRAVCAAQAIQRIFEADRAKWWKQFTENTHNSGLVENLKINTALGIGINANECFFGPSGNYTCVGQEVNIAQRLESNAAKGNPVKKPILLSQPVRNALEKLNIDVTLVDYSLKPIKGEDKIEMYGLEKVLFRECPLKTKCAKCYNVYEE
ncbi:MAG: adenylate/guanylate cyclase domain-containing protein [Deltaproteobacteria bacterium]